MLVVLGVDAVTGWSDAGPGSTAEAYIFLVVYLPVTWPIYLVIVAVVTRLTSHPRRWAVALSPVLGLPLFHVLLALITAPPIAAMWLFFLAYGSLVHLPTSMSPDS